MNAVVEVTGPENRQRIATRGCIVCGKEFQRRPGSSQRTCGDICRATAAANKVTAMLAARADSQHAVWRKQDKERAKVRLAWKDANRDTSGRLHVKPMPASLRYQDAMPVADRGPLLGADGRPTKEGRVALIVLKRESTERGGSTEFVDYDKSFRLHELHMERSAWLARAV